MVTTWYENHDWQNKSTQNKHNSFRPHQIDDYLFGITDVLQNSVLLNGMKNKHGGRRENPVKWVSILYQYELKW